MEVPGSKQLSVTQLNARAASIIDRQLALLKNRQMDFYDRPVKTSLHPQMYRSEVEVRDIRLGAMQTPAKCYSFAKHTTPTSEVVALEGHEHLNMAFENMAVADGQDFAISGKNYIVYQVTSQIAQDGSRISARRAAQNMLEHSALISKHAAQPVAYLETRLFDSADTEGDIFVISELPGALSFQASQVKWFEPAKLDKTKKAAFDRARLDALIRQHEDGVSSGGIMDNSTVYDGERVWAAKPFLERLPEDSVVEQYSDTIASIGSPTGDTP